MLVDVDYQKMLNLCATSHALLNLAKGFQKRDTLNVRSLVYSLWVNDLQEIFDCVMEIAPDNLRDVFLNFDQKVQEFNASLDNEKKGN